MGMSIGEIIQGIQIIKAQAEWDYPLDWQIVLDGAIDTMRKYQEVRKIYMTHHYTDEEVIEKIKEVIKWG